ncbi:hypothetical protein THAOC_36478, partial [Thalassiosira oceanica]
MHSPAPGSFEIDPLSDRHAIQIFDFNSGKEVHIHILIPNPDSDDSPLDIGVIESYHHNRRLAMTSYTVPLVYDKTVLVKPMPGSKKSLRFKTAKVLQPFTPWLWVLVVLVVLTAAVLGGWFSDKEKLAKKNYGKSLRKLRAGGVKKSKSKAVYSRLIVDGFLEKGLFFFSAGVERDEAASLPQKTGTDGYVGTMQQAVTAGMVICAHPV